MGITGRLRLNDHVLYVWVMCFAGMYLIDIDRSIDHGDSEIMLRTTERVHIELNGYHCMGLHQRSKASYFEKVLR